MSNAYTQLADIIEPTSFFKYLVELTVENAWFFQSGIVTPDQAIANKMKAGGNLVHLPFWNDLDGDDTITSDDPTSAIETGKVDAAEQIATILRRAKSFSATDLAGDVAGDDPMRVVAARIAPFWIRRYQQALLNTLAGVFANATFKAAAVNDISVAKAGATAANCLSSEAIIDACATMGDMADEIKAMACHSGVYTILQKANLIDFVEDSDAKVRIPFYQGKRMLVSDVMPYDSVNEVASVYFFAPGCLGYGETMPKVPVATDRDELAADGGGVEYFVSRRNFIMHPYGFKWVGTPAGASPTNAELAVGTNWTKVWDRKNIPLAGLKFNLKANA